MKTAIVLCCLVAVAVALKDPEWESFKSKFNRKYRSPTEEAFRMKIFLNNKFEIDRHNQRFAQGKTTFKMGVNQFADLTTQEFSSKMNGLKAPADFKTNKKLGPKLAAPTANDVDWRTLSNCVTDVKDQGQCGSCWSFSAAESIEFVNCRAGRALNVLSEQNLVDCSYSYGNLGCNGGWMDQAFQYTIDNNGLDTEASYPYEAQGVLPNCRFDPANVGGTITGFVDIPYGDEVTLASAVNGGVVSVAIDASHISFQLYTSGVYNEPLCDPDYLDHGVQAVGYGNLNGQDTWLVRNSWGLSWGEKGYINMSRNLKNQCGIASAASYPIA